MKKQVLYATLIFCICLLTASVLAELFLRYQRRYISGSDQLEQGMIVYDKILGWKPAPNWRGRHQHYDFDVIYTTNADGFRADADFKIKTQCRRYAVVGDSFTFGMGVNDDETFINILNRESQSSQCYLNFGIPGFSTDQEVLLIEQQVFAYDPDVILLVVYLGNDLFDNTLPFPLQANHAKPYFEIESDQLIRRNIPVPLKKKLKKPGQQDLATFVLGDISQSGYFWERYLTRSQLFRALGWEFVSQRNYQAHFDDRFKYPLQLFGALSDYIRKDCVLRDTELRLILMPGRSYILRPESPSAQAQDYLRRKIVSAGISLKIDIIDLATALRNHRQRNKENWFHPNEGHFTAQGHLIIAELLHSL
jgi:hypothetical protein